MRKLVYILIFIIGSVSIADRCIAKGNEATTNDSIEFRNRDALLYYREAVPSAFSIYLIIRPSQHTYELYWEYGGSELGTWKQKGDTLFMTPKLVFDGSSTGEFHYLQLPDTAASDFMNTPKTFLMEDGGAKMTDLTTYMYPDLKLNLVPRQFLDEDKLIGSIFLGNYLKWAKKQLKKESDK